MQSLSFTPGRAFLSSDSPAVPWTVVFEDEGIAGYFYACDRSQQTQEHSILDAMLIYNVAALAASDAQLERPSAERIATVEWSRDGLQAALSQLPHRDRRHLAQRHPRMVAGRAPRVRSRALRITPSGRIFNLLCRSLNGIKR
jgi:hypothetical protein